MKRKESKKWVTTLVMGGYFLGVFRGNVALWKDDDPQPLHIFPCNVITLPVDIRQALLEGIHIETEADLHRLLEAYLS